MKREGGDQSSGARDKGLPGSWDHRATERQSCSSRSGGRGESESPIRPASCPAAAFQCFLLTTLHNRQWPKQPGDRRGRQGANPRPSRQMTGHKAHLERRLRD